MIDTDKLLERENLKKTKARKMILTFLKDNTPQTAADIYEAVRKDDRRLSLSTVYRNCETLASRGVLLKTNFLEDGLSRYEYPKDGHIHHAICVRCHKIFPIDECPFGAFEKTMEDKYDFDVTRHRLEIYGYCHDCKEAMKKEAAEKE